MREDVGGLMPQTLQLFVLSHCPVHQLRSLTNWVFSAPAMGGGAGSDSTLSGYVLPSKVFLVCTLLSWTPDQNIYFYLGLLGVDPLAPFL